MKNYRRTISLLTTFAMCICLLSGYTSVAYADDTDTGIIVKGVLGEYTFEDNVLTLSSSSDITISGITPSTIKIDSDEAVIITMSGMNISSDSTPPIEITGSGDVTIKLDGENTLTSTNNSNAGLQLTSSAKLTITSAEGDGSTEGSLTAIGGSSATGIGSGKHCNLIGSITINGGTVTGTSTYGAGIGSGTGETTMDYSGYTAVYNDFSGSITINGGTVIGTSIYGAGIGSGEYCDLSGSITINGGTVSGSASSSGAGIGGGHGAYNSTTGSSLNDFSGSITINGGTVTGTSISGAGIGSGQNTNMTGSIAISGGYITAESNSYAITLTNSETWKSCTTITGGYFGDSEYTAGASGTGKVYSCDVASGYKVYTNDNSEVYTCVVGHDHVEYDDYGFCVGCDSGYQPATLNSDGIYEISNAGQLFWFASLVSGDITQDGITTADTSASAVLTTDIDLSTTTDTHTSKEWTPIGTKAEPYIGTFDGNGYTISGLSMTTEAEYIGLFGYVKAGTIKDLTVSGEIDVEGNTIWAGGIVGTIYDGMLSNLTSYVDVTGKTTVKGTFGGVAATVEGVDKTAGSTMENCSNYGDITASGVLDCTGGLVGYMNSATINNCANYGDVDTTGATAQQNEGVYTGGIVSYINNGTAFIINCLNYGTIKGAAVSDDYDCYAGAIVGRIRADLGGISNTYYLDTSAGTGCEVNENGAELGITAKTADELASGETTYLLQNEAADSVWGQDLTKDTYPMLFATNVVKLTFINIAENNINNIERYANVGVIFADYPSSEYAYYADSALTERIDTSEYIYNSDTTVYMVQIYTISQNLTNVASDNTAVEIISGGTYIANLTPADGYVIESVTITMGGTDITNTAYSNGTVSISDVNGNIVITAAAVKKTIMINGLAVNDNTVDVNITNTLAKSGVVIVAAYKADGSLVGFATADLTDSTVSIGIDTANASTVSAFIWDSTSTMAPLCDKYTAVI